MFLFINVSGDIHTGLLFFLINTYSFFGIPSEAGWPSEVGRPAEWGRPARRSGDGRPRDGQDFFCFLSSFWFFFFLYTGQIWIVADDTENAV